MLFESGALPLAASSWHAAVKLQLYRTDPVLREAQAFHPVRYLLHGPLNTLGHQGARGYLDLPVTTTGTLQLRGHGAGR